MIQVEPLVEIFDCHDRGIEPIGFYCEGHIDIAEFLQSEAICDYLGEKNEGRDLDIEPEELTIEPEEVQHTYWRVEKFDECELDCDCEIFVPCKPDSPNVFAVTVVEL